MACEMKTNAGQCIQRIEEAVYECEKTRDIDALIDTIRLAISKHRGYGYELDPLTHALDFRKSKPEPRKNILLTLVSAWAGSSK